MKDNDSHNKTIAAYPIVIDEENEDAQGIVMVRTMNGDYKETKFIQCFEWTEVETIEIDLAQERIAVANSKDVIRVFDLIYGTMVFQFKREFLNSKISNMEFSSNGEWFIVTDRMSDTEIFYVKQLTEKHRKLNIVHNRKSIFSFMSNFFRSLATQWSFAYFKDTEEYIGVSRFVARDKFITVSLNGKVNTLSFDLMNGGTCIEHRKSRNFMLGAEF